MNTINEIDPLKINTEDELKNILSKIGYKAKSAPFKNVIIIREIHKGDYTDEPCVWLIAQENNLESHCVITVENDALCLYCYDDPNDLFRFWNKFTAKVSAQDLVYAIKSVTNHESVMKYLKYI